MLKLFIASELKRENNLDGDPLILIAVDIAQRHLYRGELRLRQWIVNSKDYNPSQSSPQRASGPSGESHG